jgi:hypothetical protein
MACLSQTIDSGSGEKRFVFPGTLRGLRSSASPFEVAQRSSKSFHAAMEGGDGHRRSGCKAIGPVFAGHRPFGIKWFGRPYFGRASCGLQTLPLRATRRWLSLSIGFVVDERSQMVYRGGDLAVQ